LLYLKIKQTDVCIDGTSGFLRKVYFLFMLNFHKFNVIDFIFY